MPIKGIKFPTFKSVFQNEHRAVILIVIVVVYYFYNSIKRSVYGRFSRNPEIGSQMYGTVLWAVVTLTFKSFSGIKRTCFQIAVQ